MGISLVSGFFLLGCGGSASDQPEVLAPPTVADPLPDDGIIAGDDNTQPEVTLLGEGVVILSSGQDYVEEGAEANDNEDGDLSASISFVGEVNTNVVADYLLRYQVTDPD